MQVRALMQVRVFLWSKCETAELYYSKELGLQEYMNLCKCELPDQNCMFHLFEKCPDITILSVYLKNIFEDNNDFDDDEKFIMSNE